MDLKNDFTVKLPIDRAWDVLNDVEFLAPCLPGAQLQEIEDDEFRGIVKVKVGPVVAQYKGKASFVEQDRTNGRMVLQAKGRETRGQGNASAIVTATLKDRGEDTHVAVVTELTVTGKVAQLGRGMMGEVSDKLLAQFVSELESKLAELPAASEHVQQVNPSDGTEDSGTSIDTGARRVITSPEAEPVNLVGAAGAPVLKRLVPVAIVAIVILWWVHIRRSRGNSSADGRSSEA
ncbi:MAG: SRPBCC family protein [Acidimicrobiia bacterium]|nr:SRPBCC family protein [Acidimicrobiia bacterium]